MNLSVLSVGQTAECGGVMAGLAAEPPLTPCASHTLCSVYTLYTLEYCLSSGALSNNFVKYK